MIGAGPAGIAATLQLAKSRHSVVVFEPRRIGGALWNAGFVENYPGFPGGITGRALAELMEEQFWEAGPELRKEPVTHVARSGAGFGVLSGIEEVYDGAVVCTGTLPRRAGFPGEDMLSAERLLRYGIAGLDTWHEPWDTLVIGGGESSMDMALTLAEQGSRVTLLHRSEPRGAASLLASVKAEDSIAMRKGAASGARMHGRKAVISLDGEELAFDLVVVAVGRDPLLPELKGIDPGDPPPGLRVAGDARRGRLGQVAMAVGDGVAAAMDVGREVAR